MGAVNFLWTHEAIALLRQLWDAGHAASKIGDQLGISRCAVLGKVHRLGLAGRRIKERVKKRRQRHERPRRNEGVVQKINRPKSRISLPLLPSPAEAIPMGPLKTLMELEPKDCRYPYGTPGEPGFGFCGHSKMEGFSYCGLHVSCCFVGMIKPCLDEAA